MEKVRLAFMGTPAFAVPCLEQLIEAGHDVAAVYSQPPRPSGRGHKVHPSPVHALAAARGIPVSTPKSLKGAEEQAAFAALDLDLAVVVAYGLILPQAILDAPRHGCVNVHASLLPRWRGAAPIQRAILAGDTETGIAIMQMEAGLDTGPVLALGTVEIGPDTTTPWLHDRLSELGSKLLIGAIDGLVAGRITPRPQPEEGVTYATKLEKDEGEIDWTKPAVEIDRMVRALTPWPGCSFVLGEERVKLLACQLVPLEGDAVPPGTVLDHKLTVACGEAAIRPLRVQRPGKQAVTADAFLNGLPVAPGTVLG